MFGRQTQFQAFVRLLENYEVLPEEERKLYRRLGGGGGRGTTLNDAAQKRETKINQYRKEKELRAKVMASLKGFLYSDVLLKRAQHVAAPFLQALRARRGHAELDSPNDFDLIASLLPKAAPKANAGRETHDADDEDDEDEDAARDITLVLLRLVWTQALSQLESMTQEMDLLRSAPREDLGAGATTNTNTNTNDGDATWSLDRVPVSGGPDGRGPLMDQEGRVRRRRRPSCLSILTSPNEP